MTGPSHVFAPPDDAGHRPGRIFLLSPARLDGVRGRAIVEGRSSAAFMPALADGTARLDDVFAFISSLYFRGKRAYAQRFGNAHGGLAPTWVVTSTRGLVPSDTEVGTDDLREMAGGDIDAGDPRYRDALATTARRIHERLERLGSRPCRVVLLGSLASGRYVEPLLEVFGSSLEVPVDFVGRGDMSRGGLMLRRADSGDELGYAPVQSIERRGSRPPKLPRRR